MSVSNQFPSLLKTLTSQDIAGSVRRLEEVFAGNYGDNPILCRGKPIGRISVENKKIYVTFRGVLDNPAEILSTANIVQRSLDPTLFKFEGKVHAGLYSSFLEIKEAVFEKIQQIIVHQGIQQQSLKVIVEGYSRGGGITPLVVADLANKLGVQCVGGLTYAPIGVLDQKGADNYNKLISPANHLFFKVEEDPIPTKLGTSLNFAPLGTPIHFSVKDSEEFKERLKDPQLTYAVPNRWVQTAIKAFISKEEWEGHMIPSYRLAAQAFEQYKSTMKV